jgi:hypothetical protein
MEYNLTGARLNIKRQPHVKRIASEADSYVTTACRNKITHRSWFPRCTHKFKVRIRGSFQKFPDRGGSEIHDSE